MTQQQSLTAIRTKENLTVELVAAEPLVASPVAIDWGPDGRLWVAEMVDYPAGLRGGFEPGGRVRMVQDTDGGGRYDRATIFLDKIPFPTGVTVWRKGVLVCAAPDILYAEDTDGDGRADVVRKLFSGFGTGNYQARVNSLEYGLDGWVYGSCGLFGGEIHSFTGAVVRLGDRDFRIKPDAGIIEPATGRTQQGRVRDDWGNWFGCDNTNLCRHYPLADHYLRRNPHVAPPPSGVNVPDNPDPDRLYPARPDVQLFKLSGPPGRTTAACGLGIYRDDLLGTEYTGNTFTCEATNLLVHRLRLTPRDSTFAGRRDAAEADGEFLASTNSWFRPVQARTGPDGCLWIVDMHRFVIEHPRWIPPDDLAKLDVRAGSELGRICRVRPREREARPMPRLDRLDTAGLVAALDSPNGWQRDLATQMLLWRADRTAAKPLELLATSSRRAEARLHALCVLDGLGGITPAIVGRALADTHPGVRRHAIRLAEPLLDKHAALAEEVTRLVDDADPQVRLQLACSLGEWHDSRSGSALATLGLRHGQERYLAAALLSSVHAGNVRSILAGVFADNADKPPHTWLVQNLLSVATALDDRPALAAALEHVTTPRKGRFAPWQMAAILGALDTLERQGRSAEGLPRAAVIRMLDAGRQTAADTKAAETERLAGIALLGREPSRWDADLGLLGKLLAPQHAASVQGAALTALARIADERSAQLLTAGWKSLTPALKSQALDLLLGRAAWYRRLLMAVENGEIPASQIDATRRQRLLRHKDEQVRTRAAMLFAGTASPDRQKVLDAYRDVPALQGDVNRGKAVFGRTCAACHRLNDVGHAVGPDLAALQSKTPEYLLTEILDPNRNLDSRYSEYLATTRSGRTFTGLLGGETATSITLRGQEDRQHVLLRSELDELQSSGRSLMPEGLEKDIARQDMADLLAYLTTAKQPDVGPRIDFAALARQLLDDREPTAQRQQLIQSHPAHAAELVAALTANLPAGTEEEYRRIPWIWRVAIAAGKRNDAGQLRRVLDVSLPRNGEPLRDWQAVVIGGGVINGISLQGVWPRERLSELVQGDRSLGERWQRALDQAATMADDEKIKTGTRYDALRMIALDTWARRGEQLAKYLAKGVHAELQMGAISGVADMDTPAVAPLLAAGIEYFPINNRRLAIDALLRTDERTAALIDALEQGRIKSAMLEENHVRALRMLKNERLRARVQKLFP